MGLLNEILGGAIGAGKKIYHGTADLFDDFDVSKSADGSIWFTDNKSKILSGDVGASTNGNVMERIIDEDKLKLATWDDTDKYSTGQLIDQGFDGVKMVEDGENTYQIFNPEKLSKVDAGKKDAKGLLDEVLELYKTEPLSARKLAKRNGLLDEIGDQIPRPRGNASNAEELRAKANAERFADTEYQGQHGAPMAEDNAPLHDLSQVYPSDIYSSKGLQYYGTGNKAIDTESMGVINSLKGKPDQTVTMYRSVPSSVGDVDINAGDWVSLSKQYAKDHGESALNGDYKIISKEVPANQLFTNGDSINEFGFDPSAKGLAMDTPSRMARAKEQGFDVDDVTYRWLSEDYPDNKLPTNSRYKFGDAIYSSPEPSYGQAYANELSSNPVAYPMVARGKIANKDDAIRAEKTLIEEGRKPKDYTQSMNAINQQLKAEGFTGLDYAGERMMFDEDTSRSIFAAFDPAKKGSSNILASNPVATAGAVGMAANANSAPQGILNFTQGRDTLLTKQESEYLNNANQLQGLLGAKDNNFYNYSDMVPLKRHKDTGDYSLAMTGILRDVIEAGHDALIQPQNTGITNRKSLWDIIL